MNETDQKSGRKNLTALFMAWGNFTVLPCPYKHWDSRLNHRMLMYLPVIGAVIGTVWVFCLTMLRWIGLPSLLLAASAEYLLFRLCGYMHLDGFMDVSDAVMSRRPLEERQRILKDSRVGAFAVISLAFLLLLWFAAAAGLFSSAAPDSAVPAAADAVKSEGLRYGASGGQTARQAFCMLPLLLAMVPVISRACAGRMVLAYAPIRTSQYVEGKDDPGQRKYRIGIYVLMAVSAGVFCAAAGLLAFRGAAGGRAGGFRWFGNVWTGAGALLPWSGARAVSTASAQNADLFLGGGFSEFAGRLSLKIGFFPCGLIFVAGLAAVMWTAGWTACRHARRQLGGMNGDIAGYTICVSELTGMIVLALLYM